MFAFILFATFPTLPLTYPLLALTLSPRSQPPLSRRSSFLPVLRLPRAGGQWVGLVVCRYVGETRGGCWSQVKLLRVVSLPGHTWPRPTLTQAHIRQFPSRLCAQRLRLDSNVYSLHSLASGRRLGGRALMRHKVYISITKNGCHVATGDCFVCKTW